MSHIVSASDEKTGLNKMENNCEANMSDLKVTIAFKQFFNCN